jgi:NADPH:quinone reductase-like Zn-dependent oxidoreductase
LIAMIGGLAPAENGGMVPMLAATRRAVRITVGSRRMFEDMNRALEVSQVHPVIDRVFNFDEAPDAYRYLESQEHIGKVVARV